jgi:hypothetical protein
MRARTHVLSIAAALALVAGFASASSRVAGDPRVWQSDLQIQSLEAAEVRSGGSLNARIVITAEGSDPARAVRVEIMLPIGVGVLRLADGCKPSASPVTGLNARVTCDVGDVQPRGTREITISTTSRASTIPLRFAAFAYSDTPDPSPANNFAEKTAQ